MDTGVNTRAAKMLIVNNVTFATAGKYTCSAQFGNITAKRDVFISVNSKWFKCGCKFE